jgi:hypothetical protein
MRLKGSEKSLLGLGAAMAIPDSPELTSKQIQQLVVALRVWVKRHPRPDVPFLSFVGSRPLSPRQISSAVAQGTKEGEDFLRMVRFGIEVESFERIVIGFSGPGPLERE